jgi:hypothetical protein
VLARTLKSRGFMMTNAPDSTATALAGAVNAFDNEPPGLIERALRTLQCALCGVHGHESVLQHEPTRMYLRCMSCGYETPGWDVGPAPQLARSLAESRSRIAAPRHLTVMRRVA